MLQLLAQSQFQNLRTSLTELAGGQSDLCAPLQRQSVRDDNNLGTAGEPGGMVLDLELDWQCGRPVGKSDAVVLVLLNYSSVLMASLQDLLKFDSRNQHLTDRNITK